VTAPFETAGIEETNHNDIRLGRLVVPGLPPVRVRGRRRKPVFSRIPAPCLIPAGTGFAGMKPFAAIYIAVYKKER
jgi:hypothetical protein